MKNLLLVFAVFGALVLGCSAPKDSNSGSSSKPNTAAPSNSAAPKTEDKPIAISSKDLVKAYKENEVAADGKYQGKMLAVTGKVTNVAETFGSYTAQLEGVDIIVSVQCSFADSEKEALAKLKKGQTATLVGKGDGMTAGLYVGLKECKVQ